MQSRSAMRGAHRLPTGAHKRGPRSVGATQHVPAASAADPLQCPQQLEAKCVSACASTACYRHNHACIMLVVGCVPTLPRRLVFESLRCDEAEGEEKKMKHAVPRNLDSRSSIAGSMLRPSACAHVTLRIRPACDSDRGPCHRGQSLRLDGQIIPRTPN